MVFDKVTPEFKSEFDKLVSKANSILITSHKGGDDDSVGCVLSMFYILNERYPDKKIEIIYSQEINQRWSYFKNFDQIKTVDDIANIVNNYDLTIYLDSSEYSRFSDLAEKLKTNTKKSICLDHHKNNPDNFDLTLVDSNTSSCCELVYFLLVENLKKVPKDLAEMLLLGILGDTGNLEFIKSSQAYILEVVQRLIIEGNINVQELKAKYNSIPLKVFLIIQELVKNTTIKEIKDWPKVIVSYLDPKFIQKNKYTEDEVRGATNILIQALGRNITEAPWVIYVTPKLEEGYIAINLRSRPGSVNVRKLMQDMNIGGGHDRAAGGSFRAGGSIKENNLESDPLKALEKIFKWMETHKPEIN